VPQDHPITPQHDTLSQGKVRASCEGSGIWRRPGVPHPNPRDSYRTEGDAAGEVGKGTRHRDMPGPGCRRTPPDPSRRRS
jgi:hypothetical protein